MEASPGVHIRVRLPSGDEVHEFVLPAGCTVDQVKRAIFDKVPQYRNERTNDFALRVTHKPQLERVLSVEFNKLRNIDVVREAMQEQKPIQVSLLSKREAEIFKAAQKRAVSGEDLRREVAQLTSSRPPTISNNTDVLSCPDLTRSAPVSAAHFASPSSVLVNEELMARVKQLEKKLTNLELYVREELKVCDEKEREWSSFEKSEDPKSLLVNQKRILMHVLGEIDSAFGIKNEDVEEALKSANKEEKHRLEQQRKERTKRELQQIEEGSKVIEIQEKHKETEKEKKEKEKDVANAEKTKEAHKEEDKGKEHHKKEKSRGKKKHKTKGSKGKPEESPKHEEKEREKEGLEAEELAKSPREENHSRSGKKSKKHDEHEKKTKKVGKSKHREEKEGKAKEESEEKEDDSSQLDKKAMDKRMGLIVETTQHNLRGSFELYRQMGEGAAKMQQHNLLKSKKSVSNNDFFLTNYAEKRKRELSIEEDEEREQESKKKEEVEEPQNKDSEEKERKLLQVTPASSPSKLGSPGKKKLKPKSLGRPKKIKAPVEDPDAKRKSLESMLKRMREAREKAKSKEAADSSSSSESEDEKKEEEEENHKEVAVHQKEGGSSSSETEDWAAEIDAEEQKDKEKDKDKDDNSETEDWAAEMDAEEHKDKEKDKDSDTDTEDWAAEMDAKEQKKEEDKDKEDNDKKKIKSEEEKEKGKEKPKEKEKEKDTIMEEKEGSKGDSMGPAMISLTPEERSELIKQELIETEKKYVSYLKLLIEVFQAPLQLNASPAMLTVSEIETLFSKHLTMLYLMHHTLLNDLLKQKRTFAESLSAFVPYLKTYTIYINNYSNANRLLMELNTNPRPKLNAFLQKCQSKPECNSLDLSSFLIMPIQRLPRYELFLKDLVKYTVDETEKAKFEELLSGVREINKHVDTSKQNADNMFKLQQLQQKLVIPEHLGDFNLFNKMGRSLIREARVYVRKNDRIAEEEKRRYSSLKRFNAQELLIFNDVILITKHFSQGGKYHVSDIIDLEAFAIDESTSAEEEDEPSSMSASSDFMIGFSKSVRLVDGTGNLSFDLKAASEEELQECINDITMLQDRLKHKQHHKQQAQQTQAN